MMRTTTTCTGNQKLFDEFTDLTLVCLPDDDDRFDGVPAQSVVASGNKLFVRESEWPTLRAERDAAVFVAWSRSNERAIRFRAPMVRAVLDGRKTQTRRVLLHKGAPVHQSREEGSWRRLHDGLWYWLIDDRPVADGVRCPFGAPGDRLWVRETWSRPGYEPVDAKLHCCGMIYRADFKSRGVLGHLRPNDCASDENVRWRPSIHMPRWASRITLEVTGVRVERLQEISYDDCIAEGIKQRWTCINPGAGSYAHDNEVDADYRRLWNEINGAGSWDANPWVWVVAFRRIEPAKERA